MNATQNLRIRPERVEDYPAVREVNYRAFDHRDAEPDLVEAIRRQPGFIPALSIVAEVDGRVVGHILFSPAAIETAGGLVPVITLAPLAVLPEYQHQGIGSALTCYGLAECARLGQRIAILFGHPNYYPRFGFSPASRWGLTSRWPEAGDAFMALELQPGALEGVSGMLRLPAIFDNV